MDYITRIKKNKRRYFGWIKPITKYQKRKESTILSFLFFQKKVLQRKKLNEFKNEDIGKYLKTKQIAKSTRMEKEKILKSFYSRNFLGLG